jgi:fatty acid desaturase
VIPGPTRPLTAGDVLTPEELRHLRRLSGLRGAGLVLHAWGVIAAAMAACALWPSALTLTAAVAVIGSRQLGLAVLMHETAHWLLFPAPRANTLVGRWLCAFPLWADDLPAYRRSHHLHHRHTQQAGDPDRALVAAFPVARGALGREALLDLCGWTAGARLLARPRWRRLRGPLLVNAGLAAALAAAGHGYLYPLLWLLPLATWYPLVSRLRTIAEHALASGDDDPLRNTRTIAAGPLARAFLAPYRVNYHLEHHLMVFVPCWKLPRVHALLLARGHGASMERAPGYLDVLRRATRA